MTESFVRPGNTMETALPETALVNLFNCIPEYGDYKERIRNGSRENYLLCIKQRALVITPSTSVSYHRWKHRPVLIFLENVQLPYGQQVESFCRELRPGSSIQERNQACGPRDSPQIRSDREKDAFCQEEGVVYVAKLGESCHTMVDCNL